MFNILANQEISSPINEPIIVDTFVHFERGKSKDVFPASKMYGDEDNLRKAICDALVKQGFIADDAYIIGGENYKLFDSESWGYIEIWIPHYDKFMSKEILKSVHINKNA